MRSSRDSILIVIMLITAFGCDLFAAEGAKTEAAKSEAAKARIVPIVAVKPGEKKELLLSLSCTVGVSRSGGLDIREMGGPERPGFSSSKVWKRDGVTVQVPDAEEGTKETSQPQYAALTKQGLQVFTVTVTAAKDAKAGAYDLHLADYTCSGDCHTDLRVLVIAP